MCFISLNEEKSRLFFNVLFVRLPLFRSRAIALFQICGGPLVSILKPNNENYKRNVLYKGAITWNTLPVYDRNIKEYREFKDLQKRKLLESLTSKDLL